MEYAGPSRFCLHCPRPRWRHALSGELIVLTLDRPITQDEGCPDFSAYVTTENGARVVHLSGELDLSTIPLVGMACLSSGEAAVVVDLADMTFMDWCGYKGLVTIRHTLRDLGGSLTLCNLVGQPARALATFTRLGMAD